MVIEPLCRCFHLTKNVNTEYLKGEFAQEFSHIFLQIAEFQPFSWIFVPDRVTKCQRIGCQGAQGEAGQAKSCSSFLLRRLEERLISDFALALLRDRAKSGMYGSETSGSPGRSSERIAGLERVEGSG